MTEVVYASCPTCGHKTFRFLDENPAGEYPDCRFECTECGSVWAQPELAGIEYLEIEFR